MSAAAPAFAQQTELPVFLLATPQPDEAKLQAIAQTVAPDSKLLRDPANRPETIAFRAGDLVADVDLRSGAVFVADLSRVWNGAVKADVPSVDTAKLTADKFLAEHELLRIDDKFVQTSFKGASETAGGEDAAGRVQRRLISRHLNYGIDLRVEDGSGTSALFPVVGGGSEFRVSVGERGRVVAYQGGWRGIEGVVDSVEVLPKEAVLKAVVTQFGAGKQQLKEVRAELAYYAAPAFERQEYLAPVWVVNGSLNVDGEDVPIRTQILAATKYGPIYEPGAAAPAREPGSRTPKVERSDEGRTARTFLDWLVPRAQAADPYECGTSWIGASQGLGGSAGNRQGFKDRCSSAGWQINFDWGDAAAWESDFRRNDDSYVDAADLVFYTGHANANGWVLNNPDDTFLNYTEVAGASDLYGQNDLEWLVVAACGPFQSSHFVGGVSNAFDRWRPIFDGMHVALGYGAVTYDNTSEGRRFMELSQAGWNVIDAWFRTAQEIQPSTNGYAAPNGSTIYVVAMYAHNGDHCARNDHLWATGSTCADVPPGPGQQRYMLWSGT